jgi:TonB family protein
MKSCPKCGKQYSDSEVFCETDGTALAAGTENPVAKATTLMPGEGVTPEQQLECPVCGGKAQPGEVICNFCGARLGAEKTEQWHTGGTGQQGVQPANFGTSGRHPGPQEFGDSGLGRDEPQESPPGRRILRLVGFSVAALAALAAGAWFAIFLSHRNAGPPVAASSPAAPAETVPFVELAHQAPVRVQSDGPGNPARDTSSLLRAFDDHKAALADVYKSALASDNSLRDGMVVRLHVAPDGRIDNGAVRVSTSGNPSFDAEIIQAMTSWKLAPAAGPGLTADYRMIFAPRASDAERVESDLNTRLASLGPDESPEYAFAPSGASPGAAASPPAGVAAGEPATPSAEATPAVLAGIPSGSEGMPSPAVSAPEEMPTPAHVHRRNRAPRRLAAVPPSKPPLIERVNEQLRTTRRLRRVQAYTNGSTVTIFGKVFDSDDRLLAERTVRHADGVSNVVNNVTTDADEWAQNQTRISQALQNQGLADVAVKVIGRDAYLSGQVKNPLDRERAVTVVQAAAPVTVRENLITVAVGNMLGF